MKAVIYYNCCVYDVFIIFNSTAITEEDIMNIMNTIHSNLQLFLTHKDSNSVNKLLTLILKKEHKLEIDIYRKPTTTGTTIHFTSDHPLEYKLAAYCFLIN
jgi:hypothetical protein